MNRIFYSLYGVWAILAICSHFIWANWWITTSFIWLPIGVGVSVGLVIVITLDVLARMKKKEEKAVERTCENCIFGHTAEILEKTSGNKEKCLGESLGDGERGKVCPHFMVK